MLPLDTVNNDNIGLIPLDGHQAEWDMQSHIGYVDGLIAVAEQQGIEVNSPDLPVTKEQIEAAENDLIASIISEITKSDSYSNSSKALNIVLNTIVKSGINLDSKQYQQLTGIISDANYSESRDKICKILIRSEYQPEQKEITALMPLLEQDNSLYLIELLIKKDCIDKKLVTQIIESINNADTTISAKSLCKEQLLKIAANLYKHTELKENIQDEIVEFVDSHSDITFVAELVKGVNDDNFFSSINEKITQNLNQLNNLLAVEKELKQITELQKETGDVDLSYLKELLCRENIILTDSAKNKILALDNIETDAKSYSTQVVAKKLTGIIQKFSYLVRSSININTELLKEYEQFIMSELPSSIGSKNINSIFERNTYNCLILLNKGNILSEDCANFLINKLAENINKENPAHITEIIRLISTFASSGKIKGILKQKSTLILGNILELDDSQVQHNLLQHFNSFVKACIVDDTLISDLCSKYTGKIKYADRILDSLEIMQSGCSILPESVVSFIIGIVLDKDKLSIESIETPKKALSLLKGSVASLTEQNISDLAVILDKALSTQSAGELSEGLEYIQDSILIANSISNYSISCAVMQLFANYASLYKTLPEIAVNILTDKINSEAVESTGLTNILLQSLGQIAIINPDLFDQEVIEYIKSSDSVTANRIELNSYLAEIAKLLDNLKANFDKDDALDASESTRAGLIKAIEKALGAAVDLLLFADGKSFDKLYELLGKTLKTAPKLYDQCFDLIIQASSTQQNGEIVDLLIELNKLSYEELFIFASLGCYSPLLKKHVEEAFLENIEVIKSDRELVKEVLAGVKNLTIAALKEHDTIAGDVVSGLIDIAIIYPDQRLNILRTIYLNSSNLEDNHFSKLEDLLSVLKIEDSSTDLLDIIASLFTINHKVISNQSSIDLVLGQLNDSSDITSNKIKLVKLLTAKLQMQGNILIKLNSDISLENKLDLIEILAELTSQGSNLHPEIINHLLNIFSNKTLAKAVIKVLSLNANNLSSILSDGKFSLNASQIICSYKEELKEEYLLLQEFISEDVDLYIENAKEQYLRAALEEKFTDTYVTNATLCQIQELLDRYSDSEVFSQKVLLGSMLEKADSIWEYEQFLKLINKYNISEDKICPYDRHKGLRAIMDTLSADIVTSILKGISGYIAKYPNSNIADNIKSINNNCYELKSCGWSFEELADILKHLTKDSSINPKNIEILHNIFADLAKYKIAEYDRDKNGRSVFDVIKPYNLDSIGSYQEIEESIYSIFNNKFVYKPENTGEILLDKLLELNPDVEDKLPEYKSVLKKVRSIYKEHGAIGLNSPICDWSIDEITTWCTEYVSRYGGNVAPEVIAAESNENITGDEDESTLSKPEFDFNQDAKFDLAELIAVLQRANNIHTKTEYNKKGNLLRDTQIVSLLMLLEDNAGNNGKLLQVATGEGKSAISAMLAAILALQGEKVDIVTSSRVLAKTGYENAKGFFAILGLSCGINVNKEKGIGQKACYRTDVVYGDSLSFQSDYLSNSSHLGERRGDREFSKVIIDEVDSMLIDGKSGLTKQTNPTPLMEFLLPVMSMAWDNFQRNILPHFSGDNSEEIIADTTKMIEELIDALPIPKHLIEYAKYQADKWSRSLYMATCVWELDKDYVINKSIQGTKVINPVDKSTGVTRENTVWENGLHQFLQIKHKCRMSQEGLTCFFTSYINYFLQYDKILGMSGTLGSKASMEFLKGIYNIELEFVPTYKDKQCIDIKPVVTTTKQEHLAAISASAIREAETHQRAVLVVCKTIREVDELCNVLQAKCSNGTKIINYSRSEAALYNNQIDEITEPNTIIVATALAGRGTDIKTSKAVEANGGLHVIATSITSNAREEEQIQGRTARQGNSGTYQNIILDREYYNDELFSQQTPELLVGVKNSVRDDLERESLSKGIKETVPDLLAKDEIYKKFSSFYGELMRLEKSQTPRIQQLVEDFGLWLKMREDSDDIDSFISDARDKYQNGIFTNPSYVVNGQKGIGTGQDSLFKLRQAIEHDDIYNLAAHYYSAKCFLGLGKEYDGDYKSKACQELMETADRASELISYLTAMSISLAGDTENNEPLQQTTNKILFLKSFIASIQKALDSINSCPADMEVRPGGMINVKLMVPELTEEDEQEIEFIGIEEIFDAEIYKPEPKGKWWANVFVACCGMLQMFVGICVVVTTGGAALKLGTSIFVEGLMDAYKAVRAGSKGENIDLDEYFTGKAVSYAVIGAQTKINSMNAAKELASKEIANEAAKETVKEGVKEGVKDNITHPFQELIKESAIKIGETVATQYIAEMASQAVRETVLDGLEDRMKDAISKTVDQALTNNPILLSKAYSVERQQIMQSIKQAIMQAVKTHKHVQIINSLASGLLKATGAAYGNLGTAATAIYTVHKAGQTIDAASKIEPIIDDIKKDILDIINSAAVRAIARPKAFISVKEDDEASSLRIKNEMADSIGAMVSNILMNQIQRNVTMPLVTEAASVMVNKTVEEYRAKHNSVLKNYKKDIGVAAGDNIDSLDRSSEVAAKRDDSENKPDARNAQQNRHPMTRKVSIEESKLTMEEIAEKTGQPIYLFKDRKLENIYGQDQSGTPITIGYDSISDNYSGARFADTISLNTPAGNIYEIIAEQTIGRYSSNDLLGMHNNVQAAFGANNRSIMLQGNVASGRFVAYQAPSSNSLFDQELINLQDRVNYYAVLAASQKQQQQSSTVEMSQETVRFLSNVFQFDNSSPSQSSTTSGSYQPSNNKDPVPLYDVARQSETVNTDGGVGQEADYSFANRSSSGMGEEDFWSRSGYVARELFGIQSAEANSFAVAGARTIAITGGDVMLNILTLGGSAKVLMPETFNAFARTVGPAALPVTAGMIAHNASTQHADDINRYASIAKNSDNGVEITVADRMAANPYGWFDESYPTDRKAVEHIAKGRALEREGKIGKAVVQRAMPVWNTETSSLLKGMDTSSDRPAITDFSIQHKPKSILPTYTPDQSTELAELSRLPGFTPSMLEAWQESFPDDSSTLAKFGQLEGFTPSINTDFALKGFDIHEQDWKDLILQKENPQFDEYLTNIQSGDKIDNTKIYYKDAPYHHQNSTGIIKSKAPTNSTLALENTFKIKDTTKRLIGVDVENKEIIIFDCTMGNEYHGHRVDWQELREVERNILVKNNLAHHKKGLK